MRAPYQVDQLATSIASLLDGFHMRWIAGFGDLADPHGDENRSLVTRVAVMLFDQFTEPVPADGTS